MSIIINSWISLVKGNTMGSLKRVELWSVCVHLSYITVVITYLSHFIK